MKTPANAQIYDLPVITLSVENTGMFCAVSKKGVARTVETAKKTLEEFKKITGGQRVCLLIDATNAESTPREVREYAASEFPQMFKAIAIISSSPFGKMVANIFFTIKPQSYPIKIFNDEKNARNWLKQYLS